MICNFIYNRQEKLINHASVGEIILLDKKFNAQEGEEVLKTFDKNIKSKYIEVADKKINIEMYFTAHVNEEMMLILDDGENRVSINYGLVLESINKPMDEANIMKHLSKLGSTPFKLDKYTVDIDNNIFINIRDLNEIRRQATNELIKVREDEKKDVIINDDVSNYQGIYNQEKMISVLVRSDAQLECALENQIPRIYVSSKSLYQKYKNMKGVIYRTDRVNNRYRDYGLITELGALTNKGIGDYYLNVTNHETINEFSKYLDIVTLSVELSDEELERIMNYYHGKVNVEIIVRSYLELMIMKYCPLNLNVNKDKICHVCSNEHKYYLVDRFDKKYRILCDADTHLTHIMNYRYIDNYEKIDFYKRLGINNYRIELLDEDYEETDRLLKKIKGIAKVGYLIYNYFTWK